METIIEMICVVLVDNLGANMPNELHGHMVNFIFKRIYTYSWFKNGLKFQQGANHLKKIKPHSHDHQGCTVGADLGIGQRNRGHPFFL